MARQQGGGSSARKNNAGTSRDSSRSRDAKSRDSQIQVQARAAAPVKGDQAEGEATGEFDENYNIVSVLYHALQGAETYSKYIKDAERAGDNELVEFFDEVRTEEINRAARAKHLLLDRLADSDEFDELDDDEDDEDDMRMSGNEEEE